LPGITKENVKISLKENVLTVSGERKDVFETPSTDEKNSSENKPKIHRREQRFGSFSRSFQLPEDVVNGKESVKAKFENGVLDISIQRQKKSQSTPDHSEISID